MKTPARYLVALLLVVLSGCQIPRPSLLEGSNPNIRFGMPAPARASPGEREAYLIERPQYVLSYNDEKKTPNWVCWRLRNSDIGNAERGAFAPDPLLPKSFVPVTTHVYDGSGFDRGHMCPAKDRSSSQADEDATFYLTNVVPQSPASNRQAWERLESHCRDLVKRGHELHIACGPVGVGGTGEKGFKKTIGKGDVRVTVPAQLWKVILELPHEGDEPTKKTRVVAVIMPNDQTVGHNWSEYRVSVREVEKLTGFHFFRNIPNDIASALREQSEDEETRTPPSKKSGGKKSRKQ
jgi:endonuclease G